MRTAAAVETPAGRTVAFGPFSFDRTSRLLRRDGVEVPLPPRVLGVLALLLERPGDVVTKQELMTAVWPDAYVTETSLAEAVSVLRQTLRDDPQRPTYVQTLHRRGYRFVAETRIVHPSDPPLAPAPPAVPDAVVPRKDPALGLIVAWATAALSLLAAASAVYQYLRVVEPPARQPVRFALTLPDGVTVAPSGGPVAISSDGSLVAIAGCKNADCGIYLRPLSQTDAFLVAGSAGGAAPFFAPDGRSLGFVADGRLFTVTLAGGSPRPLADVTDALGACWLGDGQIVFSRSEAEGLFLVDQDGGRVQPLTLPDDPAVGHRWPSSVADGRAVVFTVNASRPYAAVVSMRTRQWSRLLDEVSAARVALPGYLIAQRGRDLIAGAADAHGTSMTGLPVPVAALDVASAAPQFATSARGSLVVAAAGATAVHVVLDWSDELRRLVPAPRPPVGR